MSDKKDKSRPRKDRKTVKLKSSAMKSDRELKDTIIVMMHHQEAMIQLLIEKGVFTKDEFEDQVDKEISRSVKR